MEKFELHILGCGSALPTTRHFATSQVVNLREKLFMIDCGEGAQMQLRRSRLKFSRLNHIFISHLHGDHCFGLLGLISTFGLLGRTADLHIHSPKGLEELFAPLLSFFCKTLAYKVFSMNLRRRSRRWSMTTARWLWPPFLWDTVFLAVVFFLKKSSVPIISSEIWWISIKYPGLRLNRIKNGAGFCNSRRRSHSESSSDPSFCPCTKICLLLRHDLPTWDRGAQIKGIDLLFHEATFAQTEQVRARETHHTTAAQAAQIALNAEVKQLVIGHFSARYEDESVLLNEAAAIFPQTVLARENMCITINNYTDTRDYDPL